MESIRQEFWELYANFDLLRAINEEVFMHTCIIDQNQKHSWQFVDSILHVGHRVCIKDITQVRARIVTVVMKLLIIHCVIYHFIVLSTRRSFYGFWLCKTMTVGGVFLNEKGVSWYLGVNSLHDRYILSKSTSQTSWNNPSSLCLSLKPKCIQGLLVTISTLQTTLPCWNCKMSKMIQQWAL